MIMWMSINTRGTDINTHEVTILHVWYWKQWFPHCTFCNVSSVSSAPPSLTDLTLSVKLRNLLWKTCEQKLQKKLPEQITQSFFLLNISTAWKKTKQNKKTFSISTFLCCSWNQEFWSTWSFYVTGLMDRNWVITTHKTGVDHLKMILEKKRVMQWLIQNANDNKTKNLVKELINTQTTGIICATDKVRWQ